MEFELIFTSVQTTHFTFADVSDGNRNPAPAGA